MSSAAQPMIPPALSSPMALDGTSQTAGGKVRLRLPLGSKAPLISGVLLLICAVSLLLTRVGLTIISPTHSALQLQRFATGAWSVWGSLSWALGVRQMVTLVSCAIGVVALLGLLTLAGAKWPQTHRVVCLVAGLGLFGLGMWLFPFFLLADFGLIRKRPFGQAVGLAIANAGVPAFAVAVALCLTCLGAGVCLLAGVFRFRPVGSQMMTRTTAISLLTVAIVLGAILTSMVGGRLVRNRAGAGTLNQLTWNLLGCLPLIVFLAATVVLVLGLSADPAEAYYEPPASPVRAAPATTPSPITQTVPAYVLVTLADGTQQMMPVAQTAVVAPNSAGVPDHPSGVLAVLGFLAPVIGLIVYLACKAQTPLQARSAGKGALIGAITSVTLVILAIALANLLE